MMKDEQQTLAGRSLYRGGVRHWRLLASGCSISLLLALFVPLPAFCQFTLQQLQPAGNSSQTVSRQPSLAEQRQQVSQRLAEAEALRQRLLRPAAGISREELAERRQQLESLVARLQALLGSLAELEEVRQARTSQQERADAWRGFSEQPPYSITAFDALGDSIIAARLKIASLSSAQQIFQQESQWFQDRARQVEEQVRQMDDALGRRRSVASTIATWRRDALRDRRDQAAAAASWAVTMAEVTAERLAVARSELTLLERQQVTMGQQVIFARKDLDAFLERLGVERAGLEREMEAALAREAEYALRLGRDEKELAAVRLAGGAKKHAAGEPRAGMAESRWRLSRALLENTRFEIEMLAALLSANQGWGKLWEQRFACFNSADSASRLAAATSFNEARERLKPWLAYAQRQLEISRSAESEQRARLATLVAGAGRSTIERELFATLEKRKGLSERLYQSLDGMDGKLQQWLLESEARQRTRSPGQRLQDGLAWLAKLSKTVWQFELFAVEDAIEIAGQKVTTSRSVTVGKSIGALLLFTAGFLLASYVSRRLQRLLVARFAIGTHQANVLRRWFLAAVAFGLLVVTLNLARIPLSVFAFLGGALAIGVGFGTQTLIKNFICGILILLERKVQVGDVVDVDGVIGKVTTVDIRASTVLGADGVEAVIPNATFLEQKVTNWTHTDSRQRRSLRVGVAYGTDVDQVRQVLLEVAGRHGRVLAEPPPLVLFEDFGDNALVFVLYFWLDLAAVPIPNQVASDLRYMIHRRFGEAGVVLAFPQRDVHLRSDRPLPVRVVPEE